MHPSHFLIGIPASGKSTLADWLQQQTHAQIISTDHIRTELYGDPAIQGDWLAIEQILLTRMHRAFTQQQPIIYDATNCYQPWRIESLQKYPPFPWLAWWLQIPLEDCLARNERRSRQVPPEILLKMAQDLQTAPPTPEEGFIEVIPVRDTDSATLRGLQKRHFQYRGD